MPLASRLALGRAFHGLDHPSISTSATSDPSSRGFDQGQQYPAVSRAVCPSPARCRISPSSSSGESTIRTSKLSSPLHRAFAVRRIPSVFSTQRTNPSEPPQRNCASTPDG
jgi:hypothetical protein